MFWFFFVKSLHLKSRWSIDGFCQWKWSELVKWNIGHDFSGFSNLLAPSITSVYRCAVTSCPGHMKFTWSPHKDVYFMWLSLKVKQRDGGGTSTYILNCRAKINIFNYIIAHNYNNFIIGFNWIDMFLQLLRSQEKASSKISRMQSKALHSMCDCFFRVCLK